MSTPSFSRTELIAALAVLLLFVIALFAADHYKEDLLMLPYIGGVWGMVIYFALAAGATVLAPFSTLPLLPVAATLWGPLATALLSIAGWFIGALLAFLIARKYGRPLVGRFVNLEQTERIAVSIAGTHTFWSIVVVRMLLPTDLLSYAIGLFLPVSFQTYAVATLVGITPFAFVFSYTSELPFYAQTVVVLLALAVIFVAFKRFRKVEKVEKKETT